MELYIVWWFVLVVVAFLIGASVRNLWAGLLIGICWWGVMNLLAMYVGIF